MNGRQFIFYSTWRDYAALIEKENLRRHGFSLNCSAIESRASEYILEYQADRHGMMVRKGWRDAMKTCLVPVKVNAGMLAIERVPIESDNVLSAGYAEDLQIIQIEFADGSVYEYWDRGPLVWRDFQAANSKGSFVFHQLTPAGKYRKVRAASR